MRFDSKIIAALVMVPRRRPPAHYPAIILDGVPSTLTAIVVSVVPIAASSPLRSVGQP
jgi:hypothetical protein